MDDASVEELQIRLNLIEQQRNAAFNEVVVLGARLVLANKKIGELEGKLKEKTVPE